MTKRKVKQTDETLGQSMEREDPTVDTENHGELPLDPPIPLVRQVSGMVSVDGLPDIGILVGSLLQAQDELLEVVRGVRTDIQVLQDLQVKDEGTDERSPSSLTEAASLIKIREYVWQTTQNAYANRVTVNAASKMLPLIDAKIMTVLMGADFSKYLGN